LALVFGGEKVAEWLLSFQNGISNYAGVIWLLITSILALLITVQWFVEWFSNFLKLKGNTRKNIGLFIYLIMFFIFCYSSYFYYRELQNDIGAEIGGLTDQNFSLPDSLKK